MTNDQFTGLLWGFYADNARDLPWRLPQPDGSFDPYLILVSEIMLQQTQVDRVIPKFTAFIADFPTAKKLAAATFHEVFTHWNGLGYNRRAKYLLETAKMLAGQPFPQTIDALTALPGIGYNTAAAVLTYAFDRPHVFVETNIRSVMLHHFFADAEQVSDKQILQKLEPILYSQESPREFMWAMMDYGTHLKKNGVRNLSQSKHYTKQSVFAGSNRQLRGEVLRRAQTPQPIERLRAEIVDERLDGVLGALSREGLIDMTAGVVGLPKS